MARGVANNEAISRLGAEYGGLAYAPPASHSMSLHTADPGTTDTPPSEVSGGSYARQTIAFGTATAASPTGGQLSNNVAVTFAGMPAAVVTDGVVWNGPVGGPANKPQISFQLASSVTLAAGQGVTFAAGAITIKHS